MRAGDGAATSRARSIRGPERYRSGRMATTRLAIGLRCRRRLYPRRSTGHRTLGRTSSSEKSAMNISGGEPRRANSATRSPMNAEPPTGVGESATSNMGPSSGTQRQAQRPGYTRRECQIALAQLAVEPLDHWRRAGDDRQPVGDDLRRCGGQVQLGEPAAARPGPAARGPVVTVIISNRVDPVTQLSGADPGPAGSTDGLTIERPHPRRWSTQSIITSSWQHAYCSGRILGCWA